MEEDSVFNLPDQNNLNEKCSPIKIIEGEQNKKRYIRRLRDFEILMFILFYLKTSS